MRSRYTSDIAFLSDSARFRGRYNKGSTRYFILLSMHLALFSAIAKFGGIHRSIPHLPTRLNMLTESLMLLRSLLLAFSRVVASISLPRQYFRHTSLHSCDFRNWNEKFPNRSIKRPTNSFLSLHFDWESLWLFASIHVCGIYFQQSPSWCHS